MRPVDYLPGARRDFDESFDWYAERSAVAAFRATWRITFKVRQCYNRDMDARLMANHPNKHIRKAIEYAEERGWTFTKASGRAHIFGTLWCAQRDRSGCRFRVYSTPRNPEDHAKRIRRAVDACPH